MRIGHGFDVHRFGPGDHMTLGGVRIEHSQGLMAHSDGDVALHALCDALLGAAGQGDIGRHFPDTDSRWQGADSRELLAHVVSLLLGQGYEIVNVDLTIVAQKPRLAPFIEAMEIAIAATLGVAPTQVNVKATTTEGLGYTGREEGIATHAVALIQQRSAQPESTP